MGEWEDEEHKHSSGTHMEKALSRWLGSSLAVARELGVGSRRSHRGDAGLPCHLLPRQQRGIELRATMSIIDLGTVSWLLAVVGGLVVPAVMRVDGSGRQKGRGRCGA
jgi:hypothetical protein